MSSVARRALLALILLAPQAACSTATPIVVEGGKLAPTIGRANTSAGYTGEITTDTRQCRGSYTGTVGQVDVPFEMSCRDGRSGVGTARILEGYFVSGEVRLGDGTLLTVRQNGPTFP